MSRWFLVLGFGFVIFSAQADETREILVNSKALETRSALLLVEHAKAEDALVAPDNDRLTVFFSVQQPAGFVLEESALVLNGKSVLRHRYSAPDLAKLADGAVQPLYVGKLPSGQNAVRLDLKVRQGKALRSETLSFSKKEGARFIEFRVLADAARSIKVTVW